MRTTFSFVIPVYKVEQEIHRCVASVLKQSVGCFEVILVDDGSPDNCPAICDAYAEQDPRVRVIHKQNGGLSDARNAGVDAATGDYIVFLDSDDYVSLDTCEKLLPAASGGYDILVGDGICEGGNNRLDHPYSCPVCDGKSFLKEALRFGYMPMAAWLYVYRKKFLQEHGLRFKKGILHEDEQFTPRVFLAAQSVMNTRVCFYHYVIREGSITTGRDLRKNAKDLMETCKELAVYYNALEDAELKMYLLDTLSGKYLSLFQQGKLYQWGREYLPKKMIWELAQRPKTRVKALLFCISPRIYWHINHMSKGLR